MDAIHSKSVVVYGQVKRALRSGRYAPGQRIDPATLAAEFHTSPTPVRFALYRLVGEGLVADHARSGLHVPLLTELALRDLQVDVLEHREQARAPVAGLARAEVLAEAGDVDEHANRYATDCTRFRMPS